MAEVTYSNNARFWGEGNGPTEWDDVTHVKFIDWPTSDQVDWGHNSDPFLAGLKPGEIYELERVSIHSWHTKLFLKGVDGDGHRGFNSVSFEPVTDG